MKLSVDLVHFDSNYCVDINIVFHYEELRSPQKPGMRLAFMETLDLKSIKQGVVLVQLFFVMQIVHVSFELFLNVSVVLLGGILKDWSGYWRNIQSQEN